MIGPTRSYRVDKLCQNEVLQKAFVAVRRI